MRLSVDRMTSSCYSRSLQTALDDTVGPTKYKSFDVNAVDANIAGIVVDKFGHSYHVFDSNGLAPNLASLSEDELYHLWVRTRSVFSKEPVVRLMKLLETLSVWDYAGKIQYHGMDEQTMRQLLTHRLFSPPAKIIVSASFLLFQDTLEHLLPEVGTETIVIPGDLVSSSPSGPPTLEQPVGTMEGKVMQRVKAALADDAPVDLSYWALCPGKPSKRLKLAWY